MILAIDGYNLWKYVGEENAIRLIKEAGFDGIDYSFYYKDADEYLGDDYMERAKKTKALLEKYDLICNQTHAPFDFEFGEEMDVSNFHYLRYVRSMEYAAYIGAKHIVIHGVRVPTGSGTDWSLEYNYKFFKSLEPYAKKFGIKIALENVSGSFSTPLLHNEMHRRLNDPIYITCIDLGHAQLWGGRFVKTEDFLDSVIPEKLLALHIQDNDAKSDQHIIPGLGVIDWDKVMMSLAKADYQGDLTFETWCFTQAFDPEVFPYSLKLSEQVGRGLMRKFEAAKASLNK